MFVLGALALAAGCEPSRDLAVDLRTDLVAGIEFDEVRTALDAQDGPPLEVTDDDAFGRGRRIADFARLREGRHEVHVTLRRRGAEVLRRRVFVRLGASQIINVVMTRDCRGVACPGDGSATASECLGGGCVAPECGGGEAAACGEPECASDADCPTAAACSAATCVEGACLTVPDSSACPPGEVCSPSRGCATRTELARPPRIGIDALEYVGAFRVPAETFGISSSNYALGFFDVDPATGTFFLVGHPYQQAIAEFALPRLVRSSTLADLEMAGAPLQTFASVIDRLPTDANPETVDSIGGIALLKGPWGRSILVNVFPYYNRGGVDTSLVLRDPTHLGSSPIDGLFELRGGQHAAGWMSPIPQAWQGALGGTALAGNTVYDGGPAGPTAFVVDPAALAAADSSPGPVATTTLLDHDISHRLNDDLSNDSGTNDLWTVLSSAAYGLIVPGTRSYMVFGHSGGHGPEGVCYRCTPPGQTEPCYLHCAADPADYALYYWLYDVEDLVAVREGRLTPFDVRPYAYGPWEAPFGARRHQLGGGAFDAVTGTLYLSMPLADDEQGTYSTPPVIVAFKIRVP
jgi:hypothetical protein